VLAVAWLAEGFEVRPVVAERAERAETVAVVRFGRWR
jgi:hypothetical protein